MTTSIDWPFSAICECGDQEGHSRLPGSHLGSGIVVGGAVAWAFLAGLPPTFRTRNTCSVWLFCDVMVYSPSGSSIHGIFRARILEWVAISSSRGSSPSKDQTHVSCVSCTGRWILSHWRHLGSPTFRQGCFTLQWSAQRSESGITKDWGHLEVSGILTPAGQPRFGPADEFSSLLGSPLKPSDSQIAWKSQVSQLTLFSYLASFL